MPTHPDTTWQQDGACRDYPADLWFPDSYRNSAGQQQAIRAASICARCPVQQLCLTAALDWEGTLAEERRNGIWGGTTPEQRFRLTKLGHFNIPRLVAA